jgi:hypothetical protein
MLLTTTALRQLANIYRAGAVKITWVIEVFWLLASWQQAFWPEPSLPLALLLLV